MSEVLPTVKVFHKLFKYEMIINECDFDAEIHDKGGDQNVIVKKSGKFFIKGDTTKKAYDTEEEARVASSLLVGA